MNLKNKLIIFSLLFLLIGLDVYAQGFKFKVSPLISEKEINAFDPTDAKYINDNFDTLVVLEKIIDIQPPKKCFDQKNCTDEKKDVETWCATMVYGIPDTSFSKNLAYCVEVTSGSSTIDIQNELIAQAEKRFSDLKIVIPPIFIIDLSNPLIDLEYDFSTGIWS